MKFAEYLVAANSTIFKGYHFWDVILSDVGVLSAGILLAYVVHTYGWAAVVRSYIVPWAAANHWIVMITFMQHTDPSLPHFRIPAWNFQRGATATIDRDFLGWQGRFFLYDGQPLSRGLLPSRRR